MNSISSLTVSMFWYQTIDKSEDVASEIRRFLNIPPNKTDAGDSQQLAPDPRRAALQKR